MLRVVMQMESKEQIRDSALTHNTVKRTRLLMLKAAQALMQADTCSTLQKETGLKSSVGLMIIVVCFTDRVNYNVSEIPT